MKITKINKKKKKMKITKIKKIKKNENKKLEKMKRYYSEKNPQNYHGIRVQNVITKFFVFKKKKTPKLSWPMSAKSDT